jgi:RNA polymerase sigma-70 factor, ECF subfamily
VLPRILRPRRGAELIGGAYDPRMERSATAMPTLEDLEAHRRELTGYCYRMLGSGAEAEDAVQETMVRAWRALARFEGRSSLRSWLYKIGTNVCLDMLSSAQRRARPMDMGAARSPHGPIGEILQDSVFLEPAPDARVLPDGDPAEVIEARETVRLAFVAALQALPPRQRAALVLCEVLHWKASEAADLLATSTAAINSALQRARATLERLDTGEVGLAKADRELLDRYVDAFQRYDMEALTALIHEDATQSMPPYELWLSGREDIFAWWLGPGASCRGSRVLPAGEANGLPAFGQYKPSETGSGFDPWALQVLDVRDGRIAEFTFFLATPRIFPLFGLPERLDAQGAPPT